MPSSTRELNLKVIGVVTLVAVMLLVTIVLLSQGGYYYFNDRQIERRRAADAERVYTRYGVRMDNGDLARIDNEQLAELHEAGRQPVMGEVKNEETGKFEEKVLREVQKMPIDEAMKQVAERY